MRVLFCTLAISFALPAAVFAADEAKKNYELDTGGTSTRLKAGQSGSFKLQIKPAAGFKVSPEAPLKIALSSAELKLDKPALGHDDDQAKGKGPPRFQVGFGAPKSGKAMIAADATFVVCSDTICEKKTEKLTIAVDVSP